MTTTSTSTTSAINFNIENLAGRIMLNDHLLRYFMDGEISTLNVYYINNGCEIPFLVKIRKDYISVNGMFWDEDVMRINIIGQKNMDRPEALKRMREFGELICIALEQYLIDYAECSLFD